MNARDIIARYAQQREVERQAANIARSPLTSDLQDLCQTVYEALLTTDPARIEGLEERGEMPFYIARILMNSYWSNRSSYHIRIRKFRERTRPLGPEEENIPDG